MGQGMPAIGGLGTLHNLGQSGPVLPLEHGDYLGRLGALAGTLSLGLRGFRGRFGGLPSLGGLSAGGALGLAPLALLWPLGAFFLGLAPFFEEAFSGATVAPCAATAAAVSVVAAFSVVIFVCSPSAGLPRQDIHHSGAPGKQVDSAGFWRRRWNGDGLAERPHGCR